MTDLNFHCDNCNLDIGKVRDVEGIAVPGGVINKITVACPKCKNIVRRYPDYSNFFQSNLKQEAHLQPPNTMQYEHPILGEITDNEVHIIQWDREVSKRRKQKIDEIINMVEHAYDSWLDEIGDVGTTLRTALGELDELKKL